MDTYGWHYASALTTDVVNRILRDQLADVDMSFTYRIVDPDSGSTVAIDGKLAPWQITGGDDLHLSLTLPISHGFLSIGGGALDPDSVDLTDVGVEMIIRLGWLGDGTEQEATGSGTLERLVFRADSTTPDDPGYVAVQKVTDPHDALDTISEGLLKQFFADAVISNKAALQYVFANVHPEPTNLASWLRPTTWSYYFANTGDIDALCFLSMLSDAPAPAPAFDSTALVKGHNATLLIAQQVFFDNAVLPALRRAFPAADFSLSCTNDQCTIANRAAFTVDRVDASSFTVTATPAGDGLEAKANGGGPLKFLFGSADLPNASYSWAVDTLNPLVFAGQTITFASDPNAHPTQSHVIPWYDWLLLVVFGITDIAGLVSFIDEMVNGFDDKVASVGLGNINAAVDQAVNGSTANLANLISWAIDDMTFTGATADMAGALCIVGDLA